MSLKLTPFLLLLCSAPFLFAQNPPDFSGIYLRNPARTWMQSGRVVKPEFDRSTREVVQAIEDGSPIVLVVTQTSNAIQVTTIQNGAESVSRYSLKNSKSKGANRSDSQGIGRAKFKKDILLIESDVFQLLRLSLDPSLDVVLRAGERWELSSDSRVLTVHLGPGRAPIETYTRLLSIDSALRLASESSLMNKCASLRWPSRAHGLSKIDMGANLGFTEYTQLNKRTFFDAGLSGEFFKHLEQIDTPKGTVFRRNAQIVSEFADSLDLDIEPALNGGLPSVPVFTPMATPAGPRPPEFTELRFHIKWTGSSIRDLGEVPSELLSEPWPELRRPVKWYRLQIPSKGVPITDNLEIRILTNAGDQIGCISGHI